MLAIKTMTAGVEASWWLSSTSEICSECGQTYAYQMGYFCADCDVPLCQFCVQTYAIAEFACSGCAQPPRSDSKGRQ